MEEESEDKKMSSSQDLSSLVRRLEAVATRLEAAQGGGAAAAGESHETVH